MDCGHRNLWATRMHKIQVNWLMPRHMGLLLPSFAKLSFWNQLKCWLDAQKMSVFKHCGAGRSLFTILKRVREETEGKPNFLVGWLLLLLRNSVVLRSHPGRELSCTGWSFLWSLWVLLGKFWDTALHIPCNSAWKHRNKKQQIRCFDP